MTGIGTLILPEHGRRSGTALWRDAEELGFDHAWTYDHLTWPALHGRPWYDAMGTLTMAAFCTERLVLGTLVATPNYRHPVLTAREALTLAELSEGRFVLGIGAGAAGPDSAATAGPELAPAQRATRFEEFAAILDLIRRQTVTSYQGTHFSAHEVWTFRGRDDPIPLAVAGTGPRAMAVAAARADAWIASGVPGQFGDEEAFGVLRRQLGRLRAAREAIGRPAAMGALVSLSRIFADPYGSPERLADLVGRCADLGFTDAVVAWPRAEGAFAGDRTAFEKATSHVRALFGHDGSGPFAGARRIWG
ncbi:LLM class flavin-dependent oxidoreductase [Catenulispora subtropica]|uniref:LLM class flavin-dependent oxidoreductase n=1 Tax=Catenulispora subtropica TaxID=450798 RepID=A0ABN2T306_9ACTN